jgi:hypothetical protein
LSHRIDSSQPVSLSAQTQTTTWPPRYCTQRPQRRAVRRRRICHRSLSWERCLQTRASVEVLAHCTAGGRNVRTFIVHIPRHRHWRAVHPSPSSQRGGSRLDVVESTQLGLLTRVVWRACRPAPGPGGPVARVRLAASSLQLVVGCTHTHAAARRTAREDRNPARLDGGSRLPLSSCPAAKVRAGCSGLLTSLRIDQAGLVRHTIEYKQANPQSQAPAGCVLRRLRWCWW